MSQRERFQPRLSKIQQQRRKLPVYRHRDEIINKVAKHPLILVVGQTGSGKTTQIPQFLISDDYCKKTGINPSRDPVICTQPRMMAAKCVARRVAQEQNTSLKDKVGYQVRLDKSYTDGRTKLIYMTEGILLRKVMSEEHKDFNGFSAIVVDEAHERTVDVDILMGFLKQTVERIKKGKSKKKIPFRVIIMSATLDTETFLDYFKFRDEVPPLIEVPGKVFPIKRSFLKTGSSDYMESIYATIRDIDRSGCTGDILIFLSGQAEIKTLVKKVNETMNSSTIIAYPLYSSLEKHAQDKAIERQMSDRNRRRVIVSTNIAETSLTINGIVFVIDSGFSKQKTYNPHKDIEYLGIKPISKASVRQRLGRAGRVQPGYCFLAYPIESYVQLEDVTKPQILCCSLIGEVLSMLALGIKDVKNFDFISPPNMKTLNSAFHKLYLLGAVDNQNKLTKEGEKMSKFPLSPLLAKSIVSASKYDCVWELITIAAMMEQANRVFFKPKYPDQKQKQKLAIKQFSHIDGDHLTLLNVFNAYANNGKESYWCRDNFVDDRTLGRADRVRRQLLNIYYRIFSTNDKKIEIKQKSIKSKNYNNNILKSLLSGYFINIGTRSKKKKYWLFRVLECEKDKRFDYIKVTDKALPDPNSIFDKKYLRNWIFYHEAVVTHTTYLRVVSAFDPILLFECDSKYYVDIKRLSKDASSISKALRDVYRRYKNNRG